MTVGVASLRDEGQVDRLLGMLLIPFRGNPGPYPINRPDNPSSIEEQGIMPVPLPDSGPEGPRADAMQPASPMDRLASEYDRWFDSPAGKKLFQIELACVQDVMGSDRGRWLEVGVGTGRFASALGIREGLDPSEPALRLARSRGTNACRGTAEKLPFSDGSFDGLLLVTTMCFVADPRVAMQEFRRVTRPGGRLVIGMIPADSPWGRHYAEKGRQRHPFYSTAHFHTVSDVISLAETAGFKVARACSGLLNPPDSVQATHTETGIVEKAGFVCLGLSAE